MRHIDRAGTSIARRFIDNLCAWVKHTGAEAELRDRNKVLDVQDYVALRRDIGAMRPCFDLAEYILGINLSEEIYEDPVFQSGYNAAMYLVCWSNVSRGTIRAFGI